MGFTKPGGVENRSIEDFNRDYFALVNKTLNKVAGRSPLSETVHKGGQAVTYYRVQFTDSPGVAVRAKKFRTKESAAKHAMRILGLLEKSDLDSKVVFLAVPRNRTPDDCSKDGRTA